MKHYFAKEHTVGMRRGSPHSVVRVYTQLPPFRHQEALLFDEWVVTIRVCKINHLKTFGTIHFMLRFHIHIVLGPAQD